MWRYLEQLTLTVEEKDREKDTAIGMLVQFLCRKTLYVALSRPICCNAGRKGQKDW